MRIVLLDFSELDCRLRVNLQGFALRSNLSKRSLWDASERGLSKADIAREHRDFSADGLSVDQERPFIPHFGDLVWQRRKLQNCPKQTCGCYRHSAGMSQRTGVPLIELSR